MFEKIMAPKLSLGVRSIVAGGWAGMGLSLFYRVFRMTRKDMAI
jgi:hypothetical protein